jgi:AraC-like DNA-binding protein
MTANNSVSPLQAQLVHHDSGEEVPWHHHEAGQLMVVIAGTAKLYSEQGWWLVTPGMGMWLPAHRQHRASYSEVSTLINLQLSDVAQPDQCSLLMVSNLLRELAYEAVNLCDTRESTTQLMLIWQLIGYQIEKRVLKSTHYVPEGQDKRLLAITTFLREQPGCRQDFVTLSLNAGASPRTMARLFEKETGLSFSQWRERLRMVVAIDRLVSGQAISQVALDLGYQSASSFTAVFSRIMGMPPRRYLLQLTQQHNDDPK